MKEKSILKGLRAFLLLAFSIICLSTSVTTAQAATKANKEAFKRELTDMLYSVDTSTHNVYKYGLTTSEFFEITDSMKYGDCRLIWYSYYSNMYINVSSKYSKISEIYIVNADDNVLSRYEQLSQNVANIRAGLKDDMTDLDKLIYFHDCLDEICSYKYVAYQSYGACGALGENRAVCAGYTKALNMLLDMEGIEAKYISSPTIDHGWTLVKIDGEWYHVDATWDDTRSGVWNQVGHKHLLRNDEEFSGAKSHVEWKDPGAEYHSTSTRFTDWYVHDIVGKMIFDGGYWYYVDNNTNCLMRATVTGDDMQVLVDGTEMRSLTLQSVENGVATYTCNKVSYRTDETTVAPSTSTTTQKNDTVASATPTPAPTTPTPTPTPSTNTTGQVLDLSAINLKSIDSWQMKAFNPDTNSFVSSQTRLNLASYFEVDSTAKYTVGISDKNLAFCIYEIDKNYKPIVTHVLPNNTSFVTSNACKYIVVELFCPANEWNYTSKTYKASFQSAGFDIAVSMDPNNFLEDCYTWDAIDAFRQGAYKADTGLYAKTSKTRICLNDYLYTKPSATYSVSLNNSKYRLLVTQYDSTYNFITSGEYTDGNAFTISNNCSYLGVTIFSPSLEWTLSYSSFNDLFTNGFVASINRQKAAEEELAETEPETDSLYPSITSISLADYSYWKIGQYNTTTVLTESSQTKVCLDAYYSVKRNTRYTAKISDSNLAMNVYELDNDHKLIICHTVYDGESFVTASNSSYVAVELYCPANEWNYPSKNYKTKVFTPTFELALVPDGTPAPVNNIEWSSIDDWRTGTYSTDNGAFTKQKTRICLKDYLFVSPETTYLASINNSNYKLLIAQYDSKYNFISSQTVADGSQLTVADNCSFIGVSIYSPSLEWTLSFTNYKSLFSNNTIVSLSKVLSIDDTEVPTAQFAPTTPVAPFVIIPIVVVIVIVAAFIIFKRKRTTLTA